MINDANLKEYKADVKSIRRSRNGEVIMELQDTTSEGPAYKVLALKALSDSVTRALTPEVTVQLKNLDEGCEVAQALKKQCGVMVAADGSGRNSGSHH